MEIVCKCVVIQITEASRSAYTLQSRKTKIGDGQDVKLCNQATTDISHVHNRDSNVDLT